MTGTKGKFYISHSSYGNIQEDKAIEMKIIDLLILGVFIVFILPNLIGITIWAIKSVTNPTPEHIEEGAEKLAESAIPWWI